MVFLLGVHCRVLFLFFFCMTLTRTRSGWAHVKSIRTFFWTRYHYPSSILRLEWLTGIYGQVHQLETRFFLLFHVEEGGRDTSPSSSGGPEQIKKKLTKPSTIRTKSSLKKLGLGFIFYPNRWTLWRCGLRANNIYSNTRMGPFLTPLRTNVVLWSKKAYLNLEPELPNLSFFGNWPRPSKRNL